MKDAGLTQVDAWIATGGKPVAEMVVPVIRPRTYIPSHWDGLFNSFWKGLPYPLLRGAVAMGHRLGQAPASRRRLSRRLRLPGRRDREHRARARCNGRTTSDAPPASG